jgi:nucleoside-diphosphate-sugar epimerase
MRLTSGRAEEEAEMADKRRVLITGAAGRIATMVREELAADYDLSGIDVQPAQEMDCLVADLTDLAAIEGAFAGIDTVIDFGNDPAGNLPWQRAHANNIAASFNCLTAAQRAGVRRFIFTSSNRATEGYERDEPYASICRGDYTGLQPGAFAPIDSRMPVRPNGPYGIGKACIEAAGRYFSDYHGMSVLCLRLGTMGREGEPPRNPRQFATMLTPRDVRQLYRRAVEAPADMRFAIYYGVSRNKWRFWEIGDAASEISYEPVDDMEAWRGKTSFA